MHTLHGGQDLPPFLCWFMQRTAPFYRGCPCSWLLHVSVPTTVLKLFQAHVWSQQWRWSRASWTNNLSHPPSCLLLPFLSPQPLPAVLLGEGKDLGGCRGCCCCPSACFFFPATTMLYTSQLMGNRGQCGAAGPLWAWGWARDVLLSSEEHAEKSKSLQAKQTKNVTWESQCLAKVNWRISCDCHLEIWCGHAHFWHMLTMNTHKTRFCYLFMTFCSLQPS